MGVEMHSINGMRNMEVIDITNGAKIGFIKDLKIDTENSRIISLILPGENKAWFCKEEEKEIMWSDIVKIGVDVILVKLNNISNTEENR